MRILNDFVEAKLRKNYHFNVTQEKVIKASGNKIVVWFVRFSKMSANAAECTMQ